MYKVNDFVIYKNEVCIVKEIKENFFQGKDYYILNPIDDNSLKINVPIENKFNLLQDIMSKKQAIELIDDIKNISIIETEDKNIENEYKKLLASNNKESLIKIIKTTYLRNKKRKDEGKKIGEKDNDYFNKAEKLLYSELSISLNMSIQQVKEYIINKLSNDNN